MTAPRSGSPSGGRAALACGTITLAAALVFLGWLLTARPDAGPGTLPREHPGRWEQIVERFRTRDDPRPGDAGAQLPALSAFLPPASSTSPAGSSW